MAQGDNIDNNTKPQDWNAQRRGTDLVKNRPKTAGYRENQKQRYVYTWQSEDDIACNAYPDAPPARGKRVVLSLPIGRGRVRANTHTSALLLFLPHSLIPRPKDESTSRDAVQKVAECCVAVAACKTPGKAVAGSTPSCTGRQISTVAAKADVPGRRARPR